MNRELKEALETLEKEKNIEKSNNTNKVISVSLIASLIFNIVNFIIIQRLIQIR